MVPKPGASLVFTGPRTSFLKVFFRLLIIKLLVIAASSFPFPPALPVKASEP